MEIHKMRGSFENQAASATPSSSSSPSHEFSFTISFESSFTPIHDKAKTYQPSSVVDLTPADDIFFHGHLLPLHVLSNLPDSPRSSTNSLDSFTLPIKELQDKPALHDIDVCVCSNCDKSKHHSFNSYEFRRNHEHDHDHGDEKDEELPTKKRVKAKSFTFFGLRRKDEDSSEKPKRKVKFDVGHFLKKYIRMFFKEKREDIQLRKQPYSFSGKLSSRESRMNVRGRREFSAPASIRTSPTNSGVIKTIPGSNPHSSNDSTMEELQAAIQSAIAHCKNSTATSEKL